MNQSLAMKILWNFEATFDYYKNPENQRFTVFLKREILYYLACLYCRGVTPAAFLKAL